MSKIDSKKRFGGSRSSSKSKKFRGGGFGGFCPQLNDGKECILVSCPRNHERRAIAELAPILDEYYSNNVVDTADSDSELKKTALEEGEDVNVHKRKSMADEFALEAKSIKSERYFDGFHIDLPGLLVFRLRKQNASTKTRVDDPSKNYSCVEKTENESEQQSEEEKDTGDMIVKNSQLVVDIVCQILNDLRNQTNQSDISLAQRMIPLMGTCFPDEPTITALIQRLCKRIDFSESKWILNDRVPFAIELKKRAFVSEKGKKTNRDTMIGYIAKEVCSTIPKAKVDLTHARLFVIVEIWKNVCGISLVHRDQYVGTSKFSVLKARVAPE